MNNQQQQKITLETAELIQRQEDIIERRHNELREMLIENVGHTRAYITSLIGFSSAASGFLLTTTTPIPAWAVLLGLTCFLLGALCGVVHMHFTTERERDDLAEAIKLTKSSRASLVKATADGEIVDVDTFITFQKKWWEEEQKLINKREQPGLWAKLAGGLHWSTSILFAAGTLVIIVAFISEHVSFS